MSAILVASACLGIAQVLADYDNRAGVLISALVIAAQLPIGLMNRAGWTKLASLLLATLSIVVVLALASRFWGIDEHVGMLLLPAILVGGLLFGARGAVATTTLLIVYVGVEFAYGPAPWASEHLPSRAERATDHVLFLLISGGIATLLVHDYQRFLLESQLQRSQAVETAERLAAAEAFRAALVREAPVPMVVVGPGGAVRDGNQALEALVGSGTPVVGRPLEELLLSTGEDPRLLTDSGPIPVEVTTTEFEHDGGRHCIVAIVDLRPRLDVEAERERALVALEEASAAKSRFLTNMSHELRTPLNAIIGYAELLDENEDTTDPTREDLVRILESGRHLLGLIDDVLDMSRVESGQLDVTVDTVYVEDLCEELRTMVTPLAEDRGVELVFQIAGPEHFDTDRLRCRQVLLNLLTNAARFARRVVHCRVGGTAARVHFVVVDDGPGVAPALRDRLFEAFAKASALTAGTGLGLALSNRLAGRLGGTLSLTSTSEAGSTFELDLPAAFRTPS